LSVLSAERVRRLSLGVPVVDEVFPGFENGDFVVLYGDDSLLMSFVLCVRCVLPRDMGGLGSSVVFVDGGNSFSPYLIGDVARGYGFDHALFWIAFMFRGLLLLISFLRWFLRSLSLL
jgi:hypothetical protein